MSRPNLDRLPEPDRLQWALETCVTWARTADLDRPYSATVQGRQWMLRLGDFPAEPMYTLIVDGEAIGSFDAWPDAWTRPRS